uniref:Papain-family protein n=1 Tax=Oldenlandia affinis TaxID=60225 RepID=A0A481SB57_OLDAF|nr:papain-family protein [Oldenlandia affinis]
MDENMDPFEGMADPFENKGVAAMDDSFKDDVKDMDAFFEDCVNLGKSWHKSLPPRVKQGLKGSCGAIAFLAVISTIIYSKTSKMYQLSPKYLYDRVGSRGTSFLHYSIALAIWGVLPEVYYPYNLKWPSWRQLAGETSKNPPAPNIKDAPKLYLGDYYLAETMEDIYKSLQFSPGAVAMRSFEKFNTWKAKDAKTKIYNEDDISEKEKEEMTQGECRNDGSWHAVLVVAYCCDKESGKDYFIIRNDGWPDWGYNGFSKVSPKVITVVWFPRGITSMPTGKKLFPWLREFKFQLQGKLNEYKLEQEKGINMLPSDKEGISFCKSWLDWVDKWLPLFEPIIKAAPNSGPLLSEDYQNKMALRLVLK